LEGANKTNKQMKTYLCKEGKETFTIKAKSRNEAEEFAEMYNAVVIKEIIKIYKK
tara:strand:+ start:177 stop:341 length:165 start_codon:yes stop_codon:yes gene_type:complete